MEDIEQEHGDVEVIDPRKTKLLSDKSPFFRSSRLMLESHLRSTTPESTEVHLGDQGAMDVLPYQLEPARMALAQPRQRILIADAVGLGKTIECGILLSELIKRGQGRRILVITVKSMLTQFQKELWSRFSLPLTRLDSLGLQRVRRHIPTNHNPFHYYDKSIISIDTLKQDGEYRTHLESAWWDVIVIDEAHNVAERGSGRQTHSLRSRAAGLLASRSDSLILLSATPHDGRRESFASLMNMLNPTAIKNPKDYGPEDIDGLFIRRFKKDVKDQITGQFPDRVVHTSRIPASAAEEEVFTRLASLRLVSMDQGAGGGVGSRILFRTLLEKALFSSPVACASTIRERIRRLTAKETPEAQKDIDELQGLLSRVEEVRPEAFSKYQHLLRMLSPGTDVSVGWNPDVPDDRLVLFTERIDTLRFLETRLRADLRLKENQVRILHGGMSDLDQQDVVEAFGSADHPVRLLIASDVASEGINLHHQAHRLIHFDIPWSLLTFQQRNGRVDRYGQTREPRIEYLLTESGHEKIRGDQRILELLIEKDEEVQRNIGDPSEFTGLHTSEEEEAAIARAIQSDESDPEKALASTFAESSASEDWFEAFLNAQPTGKETHPDPVQPGTASSPAFARIPSLYSGDFQWMREGLETLRSQGVAISFEVEESKDQIDLQVPDELRQRLKKYPPEILSSESGFLSLTTNRKAIQQEIIRCRAEEGLWPRIQLLWEQHPVLRWMQDKLLGRFGRNTAMAISLPHLDPGESIVLGTGVIPNRKGHPLIQRWYGVRFLHSRYHSVLSIQEVLDRVRFHEDHPNAAQPLDPEPVEALFPQAVDHIAAKLSGARDEFRKRTEPELQRQLEKLKAFLSGRTGQLEWDFQQSIDKGLSSTREYRRQQMESELRQVQKQHDEYRDWITETMQTEDVPSIRLLAVFGHFESTV